MEEKIFKVITFKVFDKISTTCFINLDDIECEKRLRSQFWPTAVIHRIDTYTGAHVNTVEINKPFIPARHIPYKDTLEGLIKNEEPKP